MHLVKLSDACFQLQFQILKLVDTAIMLAALRFRWCIFISSGADSCCSLWDHKVICVQIEFDSFHLRYRVVNRRVTTQPFVVVVLFASYAFAHINFVLGFVERMTQVTDW